MANAKHLLQEKSRKFHAEQMKVAGKKKKLQDGLVKGGYPKELAKVVAELMHNEPSNPLPVMTGEEALDFASVMRFDGSGSSEIGNQILNAVQTYQHACHQSIESKVKTLETYLKTETGKSSASTPVKTHASASDSRVLPELWDNITMPNRSRFEDLEGAAPWLVMLRPYAERMAAKAEIMPGFPKIIQLADGSNGAVSFLLIPIQAVVNQGLTQLSDIVNFAKQEAGASEISKTSLFTTLESPGHILYVPWGIMAVPIGREPGDEKAPKTAAFWQKIFYAPEDSLKLTAPVWTALHLLNSSHIRHMIAQKIWKKQQSIFEHFCKDRAAIVLGFDAADTILDDETETVAAASADPSAVVTGKVRSAAAAPSAKGKEKETSRKGKLGIAAAKGSAKPSGGK
jgi:hypothetical protein